METADGAALLQYDHSLQHAVPTGGEDEDEVYTWRRIGVLRWLGWIVGAPIHAMLKKAP